MTKSGKTNKSAQKRVKITSRGKILRRSVGQNHFNAKDSGNRTRKKKNQHVVEYKKEAAKLRQLMPFK